ncbi:MAG: hypothetical protein ACFNWW_07520 [Negativicutes bacterium]
MPERNVAGHSVKQCGLSFRLVGIYQELESKAVTKKREAMARQGKWRG